MTTPSVSTPISDDRLAELIALELPLLALIDDTGSAFSMHLRDTATALRELQSRRANDAPLVRGELRADLLHAVRNAADEVTAHIGCYGEINSRHPLTLNLLEALKASGPPSRIEHEHGDCAPGP